MNRELAARRVAPIVPAASADWHLRMGDEVRDRIANAYRGTTWGNTTVGVEDWTQMLEGDDEERKWRLFEHVFLESNDGSGVRELFSRDEARDVVDLVQISRPAWIW